MGISNGSMEDLMQNNENQCKSNGTQSKTCQKFNGSPWYRNGKSMKSIKTQSKSWEDNEKSIKHQWKPVKMQWGINGNQCNSIWNRWEAMRNKFSNQGNYNEGRWGNNGRYVKHDMETNAKSMQWCDTSIEHHLFHQHCTHYVQVNFRKRGIPFFPPVRLPHGTVVLKCEKCTSH